MSPNYREDIQGLRGLAVVLVVIYHAGAPWLAGGYIGVDVFFVISGYVICGLLLRELEASSPGAPRLDFARFYARRMRRLLPAVAVVTIATLVGAWFIEAPMNLRTHAISAVAAALYASNFRFAIAATDYLGESSESDPFLHTWSLGVEEQFYLVWPLLLWVLYRSAPVSRRMLLTGSGIAAIGVASWLVCDYLTAYNRPWGFFSPWTRAWEFALGALAYCLFRTMTLRSVVVARILAWCGAGAILTASFVFDQTTRFPGAAALLPAAGATALLLAPGFARGGMVETFLSTQVMRTLGDLSYSWYLWHWPVFVYARAQFDELNWFQALTAGFLSLGLALVTFRLVEDPVRRGRWFPLPTRVSIVAGLVTTIATAAVGGAMIVAASVELEKPAQQAYIAAAQDRPGRITGRCHRRFLETDQPLCRFGAKAGMRTVVLFGDSHGQHWLPAFEEIARRQGWTLHSWTKSACPSFDVVTFQKNLGRRYRECERWRSNVMETIRGMTPDLVIMANADSYLRDDGMSRVPLEEWLDGMKKTLSRLDELGVSSIVVGDTPWPGFDIPQCLSRAAWLGDKEPNIECQFSGKGQEQEGVDEELADVTLAYKNAAFIPGRDLVCSTQKCPSVVDGVVAFHDHSHMTVRFSRKLSEVMELEIARHFPSLFLTAPVADEGSMLAK